MGRFCCIIELQARWCAGLFSGSLRPTVSSGRYPPGEDYAKQYAKGSVPRGDYLGFGIELANEVGVILPPPSSELSKRLFRPQDIFSPHLLTRPSWLQASDEKDAT